MDHTRAAAPVKVCSGVSVLTVQDQTDHMSGVSIPYNEEVGYNSLPTRSLILVMVNAHVHVIIPVYMQLSIDLVLLLVQTRIPSPSVRESRDMSYASAGTGSSVKVLIYRTAELLCVRQSNVQVLVIVSNPIRTKILLALVDSAVKMMVKVTAIRDV